MKENEFWALNALRFVLAVYLVLFHTLNGHYQSVVPAYIQAALDLGNMATTVFFILSGFLLTHVYVVLRNAREIDKKQFLIGRFSSLYPLHVIGFVLALVMFFLTSYARGGVSVPGELPGSLPRMLGQDEVILAIGSNLLLLNAWNPYYLIFNTPSWSLSALLCYYLVFPFVAPKLYRLKSPVLGLAVLGACFILPGVIADVLHRTDMFTDGLLHRNPIIRLPLFLSGVALCVLFSRNKDLLRKRRQLAALGLLVVATFVCATCLRLHELHHLHVIRNGLYLPAALALVWICACLPATVNGKVKYWSARLGGASLSMFLLHVPLFQLFTKAEKLATAFVQAKPDVSVSAVIASAQGIEQSLAVFPFYLIPLIVVCVLVQERFVVPVQKRIRRHLSPGASRAHPVQGARLDMVELELRERAS